MSRVQSFLKFVSVSVRAISPHLSSDDGLSCWTRRLRWKATYNGPQRAFTGGRLPQGNVGAGLLLCLSFPVAGLSCLTAN